MPDIGQAVKFYQMHFPHAEVMYEDETWALIRIDSLKLAFVLEEEHPAHMAFRVASREELLRRARESNTTIKLHRDGSESFYQLDPGSNAIEVIYYPEKTA
jgi:catechol-2,3-dioxygenase